jgi:hypothetical protein
MKRWPHTATLLYALPATVNTLGYAVASTTGTTVIHCNIQANSSGLSISESGVEHRYKFDVLCPLITTTINTAAVYKLQFNGKEFPAERFIMQKHEEFKVG